MKLRFRWILLFSALFLGAVIGSGVYLFIYAKGFSYLSNSPEACKNCHVMISIYDSWMKGGHQNQATCNDCHVPAHPIAKYAIKALNGFHHSYAFTKGNVPLNIEASALSKAIVYQNCNRCHGMTFEHKTPVSIGENQTNCSSCHKEVGHNH